MLGETAYWLCNQRSQDRPNERIACTSHIDNLLLFQHQGREVFEDRNTCIRSPWSDHISTLHITALLCPGCTLPINTKHCNDTAVSALDDKMAEEWKETNCHLCDTVLNQER